MASSRLPEPDPATERRWAAAAGAVLLRCPDPDQAVSVLLEYAHGGDGLDDALEGVGVDRATFEMLRALLPATEQDLSRALALGRAWVLGRRSVPRSVGSWAPVVSGVGLDPRSFPRITGETLIALIGTAEREILIATAYVDGGAVRSLMPSLIAAAGRGVTITFAAVQRLERDNALDTLEAAFSAAGLSGFAVRRLDTLEGFPHLKVLVADARSAYLGSANFTIPGMTTNFEIGALVEGAGVEAVRAFVLALIEAQADATPGSETGWA